MSTLFSRILVPCEASSPIDAGVDAARRLAKRWGASLLLLHVEPKSVSSEHVIRDDDHFSGQVRLLRDQGIEAHFSVEYDLPEQAIAHVAAAESADLIVLTAPDQRSRFPHHRGIISRVLERAPAPVLVCPATERRSAIPSLLAFAGAVVIVPVDGSAQAERAIPYAVRFAKEYGRPLVLVRVVESAMLPGVGLVAHQVEMERRREVLHASQCYLADLRHRLARETGVSVQSMLLTGDPADELVRLTQTHDGSLMIMSTHVRKGLDRLLIGSVTAAVLRETPLPVLVVPPGARRGAALSTVSSRQAWPVAAL